MSTVGKKLGTVSLNNGISLTQPWTFTANDVTYLRVLELEDYSILYSINSPIVLLFKTTGGISFLGKFNLGIVLPSYSLTQSGVNSFVLVYASGTAVPYSISVKPMAIISDAIATGNTIIVASDVANGDFVACSVGTATVFAYQTYTATPSYGTAAYAISTSGITAAVGTKKVILAPQASNYGAVTHICGNSNSEVIVAYSSPNASAAISLTKFTLSGLAMNTSVTRTILQGTQEYFSVSGTYRAGAAASESTAFFAGRDNSSYHTLIIDLETLNTITTILTLNGGTSGFRIFQTNGYVFQAVNSKGTITAEHGGDITPMVHRFYKTFSANAGIVAMTTDYIFITATQNDTRVLTVLPYKITDFGMICPADNALPLAASAGFESTEVTGIFVHTDNPSGEPLTLDLYYDGKPLLSHDCTSPSASILLPNSPIIVEPGKSLIPKLSQGLGNVTVTVFGIVED